MAFLSTEEELLLDLELIESLQHSLGGGLHLSEVLCRQDLVIIRSEVDPREHISGPSVLSDLSLP